MSALFRRSLPDHCHYCGRPVAVNSRWYLGRKEYTLECPRYTAWWNFNSTRHYMTVLDPWEVPVDV